MRVSKNEDVNVSSKGWFGLKVKIFFSIGGGGTNCYIQGKYTGWSRRKGSKLVELRHGNNGRRLK